MATKIATTFTFVGILTSHLSPDFFQISYELLLSVSRQSLNMWFLQWTINKMAAAGQLALVHTPTTRGDQKVRVNTLLNPIAFIDCNENS